MSKGRRNNRRKKDCRVCQSRGTVWRGGHRRKCRSCGFYPGKQQQPQQD